MPKLDQCHDQIVRALEKEGWRVRPMQEQLYTPDRAAFIDIVASRGANGSSQEILLVEIKCFPNRNQPVTYTLPLGNTSSIAHCWLS
jgi:XisH protein